MNRSIYSWSASGLFLGSILVLGVIMTTPQTNADTLSHIAVVLGLILGIGSFLGFIGIALRRLIGRKNPSQHAAATAMRQGLELALLIVGWSILRIYTTMNAWETGLLVTAFLSAEIALSMRRTTVTNQEGGL